MAEAERSPSDDPRARAAQTKRDRTRRRLLEAAEQIFAAHGWNDTRMEEVARQADVSPASAYNHFATKHALVGTVFAPLIRPLVTEAERDIAADRPVVDALKDQVIHLAKIAARNRGLATAFWSAVEDYSTRVGRLPEADDPADPRALAPVPLPLVMLIAHGQQTGQLRCYPAPAELAGLIVNTLLTRSLNRPHEPVENLAELLLTVTFGIAKPELLTADPCDERPFKGAH